MVTQELLSYVTSEYNKGKTREQIRTILLSGGGWSDEDLKEVFSMVMPKEASSSPVLQSTLKKIEPEKPGTSFKTSDLSHLITPEKVNLPLSKKTKEFIGFTLVFCIFLGSWLFFRPQINSFWEEHIAGIFSNISLPSFFSETKEEPSKEAEKEFVPLPVVDTPVVVESIIKDCGTTNAPDRKNPQLYQSNEVLTCVGLNVLLNCSPTTAVLNDPLFPTNLEILNKDNVCSFKLSYSQDSKLVDVSNKKLAGQAIMCPISIVQKMEESSKGVTFVAPDKDKVAEYVADIYSYGNLGVFIENNFDIKKIQDLGCSGEFINSMIASYTQATNKKN